MNLDHTHIHKHRFIVIASDGVFEFLTNQSVADMVARYEDPLDACKKVVQEAYDLWLQYEVRTDDITIICISIGEVFSPLRVHLPKFVSPPCRVLFVVDISGSS